jgi:subtilase family serine protease
MSWGASEFSGETAYDSHFTTPAGHTPITFIAASGDNGSAGAPEYPSVSPYVLSIGGTQLSADGSGNWSSETGWSGSGGGISLYESQPSYQHGVVTLSSTMRTTPDVAYNASGGSPFAVYDSYSHGGWVQIYGTSAGTPQWAALIAIADQGRVAAGQATLDGRTQTLPMLYQLPQSDFHDITTGNNGSYSAGSGYDLVTGRGTPYANRIVPALVASSSTNPPPALAAPTSLTATAVSPHRVNLSWQESSTNVARFLIQRSTDGINWTQIATVGGTVTSYQDRGLNKSQTYYYRVCASDSAGSSAWSNVASVTSPHIGHLSVANVSLLGFGRGRASGNFETTVFSPSGRQRQGMYGSIYVSARLPIPTAATRQSRHSATPVRFVEDFWAGLNRRLWDASAG